MGKDIENADVVKERKKEIDFNKVISLIMLKKKRFVKSVAIAFVLSCIIIFSIPRYYKCTVKLAPEIELPSAGGSLSSLASSFLGTSIKSSMDAIQPTLYPDLMKSKDFLISLFPIKVENSKGNINTNYYLYIKDHQKSPWWNYPKAWMENLFKKKKDEGKPFHGSEKIGSFMLTKDQSDVAGAIMGNIKCTVDKKTDVITIEITDQDKLICATIADSVRQRLQNFITDYRTKKARRDFEYYKNLTAKSKADYEKSRRLYASYADANTEVVLESFKAKQEDLENDMQLKFDAYTTLNNQMQLARAKVQERTPAFTILQGASVPIKPAGPKRVIFVFAVVLLAFIGTILYSVNELLKAE